MMDSDKNNAFAKHVPTAFIIESPFQLLCVWEAIAEFEITDYRIVLALIRGNVRNEQTFSMLKERNMDCDIYYIDEILSNSSMPHVGNYDRIMIGDYDDLSLMKLCEVYASNHAEVVFMDDGLSTIMILKNLPYRHSPFWARVRHILKGDIGLERARKKIFKHWETIGIANNYCMYTIYDDIKSKNFTIFPNNLPHLTTEKSESPKVVLIVGTTIIDMAEEYNIPVGLFEGIIWSKLVEIREKYPNTRIIYIPHGRDIDPRIERLCQCLDIEFKRLSMSIEYFVIKENLNVISVYGTLSTALSTLRKITGAPVTHWMICHKSNKHKYLHDQYTKYYEELGVNSEPIYIPDVVRY